MASRPRSSRPTRNKRCSSRRTACSCRSTATPKIACASGGCRPLGARVSLARDGGPGADCERYHPPYRKSLMRRLCAALARSLLNGPCAPPKCGPARDTAAGGSDPSVSGSRRILRVRLGGRSDLPHFFPGEFWFRVRLVGRLRVGLFFWRDERHACAPCAQNRYFPVNPTIQLRGRAGSKKRRFASFTMTEPAYLRSVALSRRTSGSMSSAPAW